jgi:hypothetical protein
MTLGCGRDHQLSYSGIAEALNSRGVHTARSGRWHATGVRNIVVRLAR